MLKPHEETTLKVCGKSKTFSFWGVDTHTQGDMRDHTFSLFSWSIVKAPEAIMKPVQNNTSHVLFQ
jgi:hypothetical protein